MISSLVTPFSSSRLRWERNCSVRFSATREERVIRLRSRLERPGRSQISPNKTCSVRSTSLGVRSPIDSLTVGLGTIDLYLYPTRTPPEQHGKLRCVSREGLPSFNSK